MQKIIEDREKRKKKWIRIGKISAVTLVSIIVLIRIFSSSYAFCNWYLPLASYSLGIRISADEVKFNPFSSKKHLNFRGLQVELKDKVIFTASRFKTKFSFFDLIFHGKYSLDNVAVERASLVISNLQKTQKKKELSGLERIRIGSVTLNDLSIRYAPEKSAVYGKAFFDEVQIDSLLPDQINTMKIRSFLAWNMPDSSMLHLPVESEMQFMLDQELAPTMLKMEIETKQLSGHIYNQDLSGLRLKAMLDCRIDEKSVVTLNQILLQRFDSEKETFKLSARGFYDIQSRCGSLQLDAASDKMNIPLIPSSYSPQDLNLRFSGMLLKNGEIIQLDSKLKLDAELLSGNDKLIIPEAKLDFDSRLTWNIGEKNLTFSRCSLKAFSNNSPIFSAKTSENFALTINRDLSWDLASADSSLQLMITQCPLKIVNGFLPFQFGSGSLESTCELRVDAEKKSVSGNFKGMAEHAELLQNGKLIFRNFPVQFEGKLHSGTLKNISSFDILSATVTYGRKKSASLSVAGKVHLNEKGVALKGTLKTDLRAITEHIVPLEQCKKLRAFFGNCMKQNEHEITLNLLPESKTLKFSVRSILNELTLPMMNRAIRFNFTCNGQLLRQKDSTQIIRLQEITLAAPGDLDLRASADLMLPDGVCEGKFLLKKISPDILRGAWLACERNPESAENWIRQLYFSNVTASANLRFSEKDQALRISNVFLQMTHKNGGSGTLTLKAPITADLKPFRFHDTPGTVLFRKFPLDYANTLTSDQCRIKILPAALDCTVDLTLKNNFRDIPFRSEGFVDHLHCMDKNENYDFGSCKFKLAGEFKNIFSAFIYKNAFFELEKQGHKLNLSGSGNFLLGAPYTGNMSFSIPQLNTAYFTSFFPVVMPFAEFIRTEADTRLDLKCEQDYDKIRLIMDQNIKKIAPRFPEKVKTAPPDLNGNLHLDLIYHAPEQLLTLNRSFIKLTDQNGRLRYHAELHGSWDGSKNSNRSYCTLTSNAADLKTAHLTYKAYRQKQKASAKAQAAGTKKKVLAANEKVSAANTAPATAPKKKKKKKAEVVDAIKKTLHQEKEPGAVDLNDFSTKLTADLKGWTYTDQINLTMNGIFTVDQNIFHAQKLSGTVNGAPFQLDAYADLGQNDGWILKLLYQVSNLEVAPLIHALGSNDLKSRNISGKIDRMELSLETKGVTNNSLDKNLKCALNADFSNISCPLIRKNEKLAAWQIPLVPFTLFPRFYDLIIPKGPVRDAIQDHLGGSHIDVLTGKKNITFDRGTVSLQNANSRKTDLLATKFLFNGPVFKVASKNLAFNPFHNSIQAVILTKFAGTIFPVKLKGELDHPEFELPNILGNALMESIKRINVFQLDDPVWDFDSPPVIPAE